MAHFKKSSNQIKAQNGTSGIGCWSTPVPGRSNVAMFVVSEDFENPRPTGSGQASETFPEKFTPGGRLDMAAPGWWARADGPRKDCGKGFFLAGAVKLPENLGNG
jgi:hypothetical protein